VDYVELYDWEVEEDDVGLRIDKFLPTKSVDWSRTLIQQWLQDGLITVNGHAVKANYRLSIGDEIQMRIPPLSELKIKAEPLPLTIVYEDEDLLIINKERGMTVHPAPGNYEGTLVNALLYHTDSLSTINGLLRPGIVHRLDRDTSGLLMVAKNDFTHLRLAEQLKEQTVERYYTAIVQGVILHERGSIDAPIGRDPSDRKRMTVTSKNSKEAVTHFAVVERFKEYTLVDCALETGRTHQIRAHLKYIGHPVVGDPKYSTKKVPEIKGQALHAKGLGFVHPRTGEKLQFTSELPEDMLTLLDRIRTKDNQE
jgi:23S rRNA pseudouridine1911/1915/1917 synthase